MGCLKDTASLSKATLLSTSTTTTTTSSTSTTPTAPHFAVLRATTHQPSTEPAHPKHIDALLAFGRGSRPSAASAVGALTDRLHSTHNSTVALKCLIAVHHIIIRGSFILQDQLISTLNPSFGGRNHLNLSGFRDVSSPESWLTSSLVRWYARVLELLLFSYRVLGTFQNRNQEVEEEKVSSLLNGDLLKEIESLVALVEEMCKAPEMSGNRLVGEVMRLVGEDRITAEYKILVRVREMGDRVGCMGFGDSVELVCLLRRLDGCREKTSSESSDGEWRAGDEFWSLVWEMKEKIGVVMVGKEEEERGVRVRREQVSESARLGQRVLLPSSAEPVKFGSSRWADR